jgi:phage/plasmid-associated DNA primase
VKKGEEGPLSPDQPHLQDNKANGVFKVSPSEGDKEDEREFPYMPGTEDIVREILKYETIKTVKEHDTDRESMYLYIKPTYNKLTMEIMNPLKAGIYIRGEDELKVIIEKTYRRVIQEMIDLCDKLTAEVGISPQDDEDEKDDKWAKLRSELYRILIHDGISHHEVVEAMQNLRRKTFVDRKTMNPDEFIPLKTGLLSTSDWALHNFSSFHFYTWKVMGSYNPSIRSLNQTPLFKKFLLESYPSKSIPTILDYLGYSLYPSFPRQKVLVIVGPPRMGKGTIALMMERILNEGFGRISLMKLLIPDNKFSLQGIEGKRLLVDTEIKREFKKNADFDVVNSLFGGDPLPMEKKYHAEITYIARSAGILIGNLPLFSVNNSAFLARLLIVTTREKRKFEEVPNMADIVFNAEGDAIVSLLLNRVRSLVGRDFKFSNELSNDEYAELWEMLSNSTQKFMDERMIEASTGVDTDYAYEVYELFCKEIGIPPETKHVFSYRVNKVYPRKRAKKEGQNYYEYQHCLILTTLEMKSKTKQETKETEEEKLQREKLEREKAQKVKERIEQLADEVIEEVHDDDYQNEDPS